MDVDEDNRITGFEEKPLVANSSMISTGIYVIRRCFLPKSHHLPELKCSFKERELYCVRTATFCTWEFDILLRAKSILLKLPATGIAAMALLFDNSRILLLFPPAKDVN